VGFTLSSAARGRFAGKLHPSSSSQLNLWAPWPFCFTRGRAASSTLDNAQDPLVDAPLVPPPFLLARRYPFLPHWNTGLLLDFASPIGD
jgi:hypothetical protein